MKERRKARRYDVALPMDIRASFDNDHAPLHGETIDISTQGICFTVRNDLKVGANLTLHVRVPTELVGGMEIFILAIGRLVRVEKSSGDIAQMVRAAAAIKSYKYFSNRVSDNSAQVPPFLTEVIRNHS
jgi:hypothetical protein